MTIEAKGLGELHDQLLTELIQAAARYQAFAAAIFSQREPEAYAKMKAAWEIGQAEMLCSVYMLRTAPHVQLSALIEEDYRFLLDHLAQLAKRFRCSLSEMGQTLRFPRIFIGVRTLVELAPPMAGSPPKA